MESRIRAALVSILAVMVFLSLWSRPVHKAFSSGADALEVFVGSASQPATEEAAVQFEEATGIKVHLHFGGSGKMLSEMKLSGRGDIYFPGSSDFMEIAKRERLIFEETERIVAYLIPAINVPRGNPAGIASLKDLARSGARVAIARPDTVCVGLYAVEILEKNGVSGAVRKNIKTHAPSCAKTAQLVSLGVVDAVLGWRVFAYWRPDHIETILLPPEQIPRIGYIPIAIGSHTRSRENAQSFIDFLVSGRGKAVFRRWDYLVTEEEARRFSLPDTPVGGTWDLPDNWK